MRKRVAGTVVAALGVAAAVGAYLAIYSAGDGPDALQTAAASGVSGDTEVLIPPPLPPLHHSGDIQALDDSHGVDLDKGITAEQNAPGVDISPYAHASHLGAMDITVSYTVLPPMAGRPERTQCEQAQGWTRYYPYLYSLAVGRRICVRTDQQRLSMLIIEKPATQRSGTIGFRYFTWEN
jgi:hypothetical protein